MQCFEYCNFIAFVDQISGTGQSCRTCSDDCDLVAVGLYRRNLLITVVCSMSVSSKSFKSSDGNRLTFRTACADTLALVLLRADSSADSRK